jgi:hypothetical protein
VWPETISHVTFAPNSIRVPQCSGSSRLKSNEGPRCRIPPIFLDLTQGKDNVHLSAPVDNDVQDFGEIP